jgi:hypothetical protein
MTEGEELIIVYGKFYNIFSAVSYVEYNKKWIVRWRKGY